MVSTRTAAVPPPPPVPASAAVPAPRRADAPAAPAGDGDSSARGRRRLPASDRRLGAVVHRRVAVDRRGVATSATSPVASVRCSISSTRCPANLEPVFRSLYRLGTLWAVALVGRGRGARQSLASGARPARRRRSRVGDRAGAGPGRGRTPRLRPQRAYRRSHRQLAPLPDGARLRSRWRSSARQRPTSPVRRAGSGARWCSGSRSVGPLSRHRVPRRSVRRGGARLGRSRRLVHLIFGSPGSRPTIPQVTDALGRLGVDARNVGLAEHQPRGSTVVLAEDTEGPLRVKVIGRDETQARLFAQAVGRGHVQGGGAAAGRGRAPNGSSTRPTSSSSRPRRA